ncbi:MAG: hypothetical protein ACYDH4_13290 [Candidatus Cryosericum sp.]
MSNMAKKKRAEERKSEKRKRKAANRAKYDSYVGTEQNKKRKQAEGASVGVKWSRCHSSNSCGNPGCKRCFPELYLTPRSMSAREDSN